MQNPYRKLFLDINVLLFYPIFKNKCAHFRIKLVLNINNICMKILHSLMMFLQEGFIYKACVIAPPPPPHTHTKNNNKKKQKKKKNTHTHTKKKTYIPLEWSWDPPFPWPSLNCSRPRTSENKTVRSSWNKLSACKVYRRTVFNDKIR